MSSRKLYPSLDSEAEIVTETQLQARIDKAKQKERLRFMNDKKTQLLSKLEHYEKLKKRWTVVKHAAEGAGITITVICGILTIIASSGVLGVPIMAILTSGSGVATSLITAVTDKTFINRHRTNLKKKYLKTKEISDNLQIYFQKCAQDDVITVAEMENFERMLHKLDKAPIQALPSKDVDQDFLLRELAALLRKQE